MIETLKENNKSYRDVAIEEYCDEKNAIRQGGVNGRPFWNINAQRFTFCPSFSFLPFSTVKKYLFLATDCNGIEHSFVANTSQALLTPIWKDIPTGKVDLIVKGLDENDQPNYFVGARTFFKSSPFLGRENYPEKACSYQESALKALRYVFDLPMVQYWAKNGKPDPEYYHNVYPSKMVSAIVGAMINYSKIDPDKARDALKVAVRAADYVISISAKEDSPLYGLPPTYSFEGLNEELINEIAPAAKRCVNTNMLLYPASMGNAYLRLFDETGDAKYFKAAERIANYYKNNVLECGSWYLQVSTLTGEPIARNKCKDLSIHTFILDMAKRTSDADLEKIANNYFIYMKKECFDNFNWEGQFEDIEASTGYTNLTHFQADAFIRHIKNNFVNDKKWVDAAEELMRYVEDQFVVWGEHEPWLTEKAFWYKFKKPNNYYRFSPAGEEQYSCYEPIDSSTAAIMDAFLNVYTMTDKRIYLEKALVLADMITRMQNKDTGVIPTFWLTKDCSENLWNFWINCHIATANYLFKLADFMSDRI